ncbi:hypothetical protein JOC75_000009 [Metabacillus crassostreae]|nr:hypothetical protein [Metabacillus crassostreae]MBM7602039.1 hypothetical protein [Metabacillus crassostreae]
METMNTKKYSNTDIEEVKRLNANSGLSYNEVKQQLAKEFLRKKT